MSAATHVRSTQDNTRELIRVQEEQLTAMWRKVRSLEDRINTIQGPA